MKILIATGIFPPDIGGPATYVPFVADEFVRRGHSVRVVTYGSRRAGGLSYPVTGVPRFPLPLRYFLFFFACVRYGVFADCIFAQDASSSGVPAACASFILRKRLIVKIVGDFSWEYARNAELVMDEIDNFQKRSTYPFIVRMIRFCQKAVCRRAACITVPSRYLKGIVMGWGVNTEKITVIPNAVIVTAHPVLAERDRFMVFTAGRFVPWKGFDGLIRAFAKARDAAPSARLMIAGDGPCRESLVMVASDAGVLDVVLFLGRISPSEMATWYSRAGCFALFSSYEGLSHVILEALSYGLPVIASDAGGNAEAVTDGINGIVVKSGDEEALAMALVNFFKNPMFIKKNISYSTAAMIDDILGVLQGS